MEARSRVEVTEMKLSESANLIAALVRACGGSITLDRVELDGTAGSQLISETTPEGRLVLRLKDA
jgi:hypothetical protein